MTELPARASAAPPEGAVTGEGPSLSEAIADGAGLLGLHPSLVEHKIDLTHFRNPETGRNMGVDTVKVWVWPRDQAQIQVVEQARAWMKELLARMDFGGEVDVDVRGRTVLLRVRTSAGGQLVGRQGATLESVQTLLTATLGPDNPRYEFRVDVADNRREASDRDGGRRERGPRRERGERDGDRRERGPRRERGERGGRDGGDGDRRERGPRRERGERGERAASEGGERRERGEHRDRPRRPREGEAPAPDDENNAARNRDIERLAHRLAKKVQETGEAELIRREMNSYARRLVHMVVAEYPGLTTQSLGDGPLKRVRIAMAEGAPEATEP
jgi:predicted RNA-binding protein Jag